MEVEKIRDVFQIPREIIPPGMVYQWCGKSPSERYQRFIAAGWRGVPWKRHADRFSATCVGGDGSIEYGGMALMERPAEQTQEAREKEQDKACLNAGKGRLCSVSVNVWVKLTQSELQNAYDTDISGQQWAINKILRIMHETDRNQLKGQDGALVVIPPPRRTVSKYRWLDWLFALISKEADDDK